MSSRRGESSILKVARAPKIDPRSAKLQLECGLEGQVEPKRCQVALGVRLGRLSWAQVAPKRDQVALGVRLGGGHVVLNGAQMESKWRLEGSWKWMLSKTAHSGRGQSEATGGNIV